jgi:hypothetical protein
MATTKSESSKVKTILVTDATSIVGSEVIQQLSSSTRDVNIKADDSHT